MEIVIILGLIGLCTIAYKKITKAHRVREQNAALAAADEPAALPQPKETKALPPGLETDIPPASLVRGGMYRSSSLTGHVAASAASIVGNEIATGLLVGRAFSRPEMPELVRNTLIRRHVGPISLVPDGEIDTDSQPENATSPVVWTPGRWLTDADVGPFA